MDSRQTPITLSDELVRLRQIDALKAAAGAWKDSGHPELRHESEKWVRELRRESVRRFLRQI
jgi:hypothetical protein